MPKGANIILSETHSYNSKNGRNVTKTKQLFFYRQSDGNPERVLPVLRVFMKWVMEGKLRNNLSQCAGWLTILGAIEYNNIPKYLYFKEKLGYAELNTILMPKIWKCGGFEPTTGIHGEIEYLYEIDINNLELSVKKVSCTVEGQQMFENYGTEVHSAFSYRQQKKLV
jgi:hypothetical protein